MRLIVIGFWGAYPGKNQASSCYLLEDEGYSLLLDCGSGALSKLPNYFETARLDSLVISHYHADHYSDLGCFHHAALVDTSLGLRQKKLRVFGPEDPENAVPLAYRDVAEGAFYHPEDVLELGPFRLSFSANVHPCLSYATKITSSGGTIVYTGDTGWYDGLVDFSGGAGLLICESSLYNQYYGKIEGHLTAGEAGKLAARAGVSSLLLSHLPHYGDHKELHAQAVQAAEAETAGQKKVSSHLTPPEIVLATEGFTWEGP